MPARQVYSTMEKYYNIVYDQCFSPSGKHLVTCDHFGHLAVFKYVRMCLWLNGFPCSRTLTLQPHLFVRSKGRGENTSTRLQWYNREPCEPGHTHYRLDSTCIRMII